MDPETKATLEKKIEELKGAIEQTVARLNWLVGQRDAFQSLLDPPVIDPPKE